MKKRFIASLVICCAPAWLMAQEALSFRTVAKQKSDTIEIQLVFDVKPGMHVYAPSSVNSAQGFITMNLLLDSIPAGLRDLKKVSWPEALMEAGGEVYKDEGHIIVFRLLGRPKELPARISGTLMYQACNENMCFPPDEKMFSVELKKGK